MTLDRFDKLLRTAAGGCAILAGSTYAGFVPPMAAVILGFVAAVFAYLAGSPLFDPTLVGKSPFVSRLLITVAGLCGAAAASSFFPQVQHLFADDHARKLAAGLTLLGAVCTYLSQSPIIAGGTGPGPAAKLGALLVLIGLSFRVSGCAHVSAIKHDVLSCVASGGPQAIIDLEKAAPKIVEDILMCAPQGEAAIPMCVEEGLATLVQALGPDGKRFELCVVNAIENDPMAAPLAKKRAKTMRVKLVMEANGR